MQAPCSVVEVAKGKVEWIVVVLSSHDRYSGLVRPKNDRYIFGLSTGK